MEIKELHEKAREVGLRHFEHLSKGDLIHAIQSHEGYQACFGSPWCNPKNREICLWQHDCSAPEFYS